MKISSDSTWAWVASMAMVGIVFFLRIGGFLQGPLADPFHHGEYFAAYETVRVSENEAAPFVIHGAVDLILPWVAERVYGAEHYMLPTALLYELLNALAALLLLVIVGRLIQGRSQKFALLIAGLLSFQLVGYRDVFLLISMLLCILSMETQSGVRKQLGIDVLLAMVLSAGLFWTFDRGAAIACAVCLGYGWQLIRERRFSVFWLLFPLGFMLLAVALKHSGLISYFENFWFLAQTSGQWNYGLKQEAIALTVVAVAVNGFAMMAVFVSMRQRRFSAGHQTILCVLTSLSLVLLKVGVNRADMVHVMWAMWCPGLILFYLHAIASEQRLFFWRGLDASKILLLVVLVFASKAFVGESKRLKRQGGIQGYSSLGLRHALSNPPRNSMMVGAAAETVAAELVHQKSKCLFDLSNHGVLNAAAKLPACTRFVYIVYATDKFENDIIDALKFSRPATIVYSSTHWSYSIDEKSMATRFPKLNAFVLSEYPIIKCKAGYCLRYREGSL